MVMSSVFKEGCGTLTRKGRQRIATVSALVGKPPIAWAGNDGSHETLFKDIQAILSRKSLDSTTQKVLVDARIGQGTFRTDVLHISNGRCAVSGCRTTEAIRASHIKPWRDSTDKERLDPRNGLALAATWDALFDAGLIAFDELGNVLISERLPSSERRIFGLAGRSLASPPHPQTATYLEYHRTHVFR